MKLTFRILMILSFLGVGFVLLGYFSNPKFDGEIITTIHAPISKVYQHLLDLESVPKYRKEITKILREGKNAKGLPVWKEETDTGGSISFEMTESIENERIQILMKESSFGMKGTWEYRLRAKGDRTEVRIFEKSENQNIFIRAIFALIGKDANLRKEIEILQIVFPNEK
ncbi:SRPBCC family protein [Leptospira sp. 201903071]|uniref:SRPBCC family protein n=1 Tax=Leptospira ainazelensis TaxID=2810034 RepID=UPI001964CEBF|nr:SRPBCC family protein [Leptospira ainazelensis]MBM9502229.1 SRPBCC family protein [Leptospira ainazelensis]